MNTNDNPIKCADAKSRLAAWLTHELSATEQVILDEHLAQCSDCQHEFAVNQQLWQRMGTVSTPEPRPQMRTQFYTMLDSFEGALKTVPPSRWVSLWVWFRQQGALGIAYSVLLLGVGVMAGYWFQRQQTPAVAYQQRIDTLSGQVQEMRELMLLSLLENPSATQRLRAVGYTKDIGDANARVIEALLMTLNNDPNVNVRLVTLEALAGFGHDAAVREGLVQSLMRQESPLVQAALADVMVKLQEKRSLKPLRQLLHREGTNSLIKSKLEQTIRQLS